MNIAIDVRAIINAQTSGVTVYIKKLLDSLFDVEASKKLSSNKKNKYILYYNAFLISPHKYFKKWEKFENIEIVRTRIPNKIFNLFLSLFRWPKIDRLIYQSSGVQPDVFFIPDPRPSPVSRFCKKVTTFHDLSIEFFQHAFSWRSRIWHKILQSRKEGIESDKIIAVSNFTKKELEKNYRLNSKKIHVVYEGPGNFSGEEEGIYKFKNSKFSAEIRQKYNLPKQYIMSLSTIEPRKNLNFCIDGFYMWRSRGGGRKISLVIAGRENNRIFKETNIVRHKNIFCNRIGKDIIFTGHIDDKDLPYVYSNSLAFVCPSFYEGFGLPILEAFCMKVPVIASSLPSFREIAGNAAVYINPYKLATFYSAIDKVLNVSFRNKLVLRAKKRLRKFSWRAAAQKTLKILEDAGYQNTKKT